MLFKSLMLFRLPLALCASLDTLTRPREVEDDVVDAELEHHLRNHPLKEPGPLELQTRGFVSPFGMFDTEAAFVHRIGEAVLFCLGGFDKILPTSVINRELLKKLDAVREREGRNPGGRERKRLKDEVITDLLPRALSKPGRVMAYIDLRRGWLVVETTSKKQGEQVVTGLREAMGSFPALPVNAESSPRALLTSWILGEVPPGIQLGDECELRDPVDKGATVKLRRQELESDEVREHLQAGKQGFSLGLTFRERLAFVIGEDIVVRKLKFLEAATEALERDERDSLRAEIDATFALMSGEIGLLLDWLEKAFSLSEADESTKPGGGVVQGDALRQVRAASTKLDAMVREDGCTATLTGGGVSVTFGDGPDPLYAETEKQVIEHRCASISFVQRINAIGYIRAARIVEALEAAGVVSRPDDRGERTVLKEKANA
jgi:recombination associated protein RdgC